MAIKPLFAAGEPGCCKVSDRIGKQSGQSVSVIAAIASDCKARPSFSCRGDCEWSTSSKDCSGSGAQISGQPRR